MTLSTQNFTQNFCVILLLFYCIFLGSQRLFSSLLDCVRKVLILAIFDREKPLVSPSPTIILRSLYEINENHRVLHGIFEYRTKIIESLWQQHVSQQTLLMYQQEPLWLLVSINLHNERLGFSLTSYTQLHCMPGGSVGLVLIVSLDDQF